MKLIISIAATGFLFLTQVSALCLTQSFADQVASNYASLFTSYSNDTANRVLSPDFTDQSDSVESLANNGTTCPFTVCCALRLLVLMMGVR